MDINRAIALLSNEAARFTASQQRDIHDFVCRLAAYEDKAPLTDGFLSRRFVDTRAGWLQKFDGTQILIQRSADTYHVLIFKREYEENKAYIKTVGQLRMLLAICGFEEFANELK